MPPGIASPRSPGPPLPPPPWAQSQSAALAPLPADGRGWSGTGGDRSNGRPTGGRTADASPPARDNSRLYRILAAVLVGLVAAAAGYFGVRIIADLATDSAAPAAGSAPADPSESDRLADA